MAGGVKTGGPAPEPVLAARLHAFANFVTTVAVVMVFLAAFPSERVHERTGGCLGARVMNALGEAFDAAGHPASGQHDPPRCEPEHDTGEARNSWSAGLAAAVVVLAVVVVPVVLVRRRPTRGAGWAWVAWAYVMHPVGFVGWILLAGAIDIATGMSGRSEDLLPLDIGGYLALVVTAALCLVLPIMLLATPKPRPVTPT